MIVDTTTKISKVPTCFIKFARIDRQKQNMLERLISLLLVCSKDYKTERGKIRLFCCSLPVFSSSPVMYIIHSMVLRIEKPVFGATLK